MNLEALIVVVLLLIVVVPLWALIRTFKLKRHSATRSDLAALTERIYSLEKQVLQLRKTLEDVLQGAPQEAKKPAAPAPVLPTRAAPPPEKLAEKPPVPSPPPPKPTAPPLVPSLLREEMLATPEAKTIPPPAAAPAESRRGWADLEERLGTNWLNKIGITAFVIGTAFFLNYTMRQLGPAGKITVGYLLAAGLLALGIFGERRERYRVPARAALGGGWALAYFTAYALHNIREVRLVESPTVGFLLLFVVAAAMVTHSLRYHSQVVTGLAYLLAFTSVLVSWLPVGAQAAAGKPAGGALAASGMLAASLVVILSRRKWYALEPAAIVVTYAVHWAWLSQLFAWIGGLKPFPEFAFSAALLTVYWAIFTVSHFLREEGEARQRYLLVASFVLNVAGYLAVMRYQSIHPEWRFWFLLGVGAVYLAIAFYSRRADRRLGFLLHSTLGATLLLVAIPYRYSGARLELIWLAEAEALLLVGWRIADAHLRKLGWAGLGILATYVTFHDLSPRLVTWRPPDTPLGWLLLVLAAAYYANARLGPRLLGEQATETDASMATVSSPVASGFLMAAAWVALPFMWTALAWAALGVALGEVGRRLDDRVLRGCGHAAALLAAIRLLVINLQYAQPAFGTNLRVLTMGLVVALFYYASRRIPAAAAEPQEADGWLGAAARRGGIPAAYTWSATTLGVLLIWFEVTNAAVALAWALAGLVLLEVGRARTEKPLVAQGHALLALSFARIFFADLNAGGPLGPLTDRIVSVTLLAALYYYAAATSADEWPRMRVALYWFGSAALVALLRFELALDWVAVGWAALTVALYFAGRRFALAPLRYQAYLLTFLVALRCAFDNFYQKAALWPRNVRTVTVVAASLLLYVLLVTALRRRRRAGATVAAPAEAGND